MSAPKTKRAPKQRLYRVTSIATISVYSEVSATSRAKAIEEAFSRPVVPLRREISREIAIHNVRSRWCTDLLDGEPDDGHVTVELLE